MTNQHCVIGAGGHAKVTIEAIQSNQKLAIRLFDMNPKKNGQSVLGCPISPLDLANITQDLNQFTVAIGDNSTRESIFTLLCTKYSPANAIHRCLTLSPSAHLGAGLMIFAAAVIHSDVVIGHNSIINTAAVIEHDCIIDPHVHVGPNATLCGNVAVGCGSFVGAGAVILPGVRIGHRSIVGAGAVVTKNVGDNQVVMGCPAK